MPDRSFEKTVSAILNSILERLRAVERIAFPSAEEVTVEEQVGAAGVYTWQSARALITGMGLRYYTERDGAIEFCRADRSSGDGASTATLDVLKNGASIYPTTAKPTVAAATFLGPEAIPDDVEFAKGDYLQVEVEATGGGTGPLRVTFKLTA